MPRRPIFNDERESSDPLTLAHKRTHPAVVIFNYQKEPVFLNGAAHLLFTDSNRVKSSDDRMAGIAIPKEITNLFDSLKKKLESTGNDSHAPMSPEAVLLSTGNLNYYCFGSFLYVKSHSTIGTFYIMVLMRKLPNTET